ncbi:MAG: hypothetical protein J5849_06470 [Clostridia bacterium]|nr:hypothetical protein [Clostridia bacterium]
MEKIKSTALSAVCLLIGVGLISTALYNRAEFEPASMITTIVLGVFLIGAGVFFFFFLALPEYKEGGGRKKGLKGTLLADRAGEEDADGTDRLVTSFRESCRSFFASPGIPENSSLQQTATQMFWHVLYLKKRRMERLGVSLDFQAERKSYGGKSLEKNRLFDAKYAVTEIRERIAAKRTYRGGNRKPFRKRNTELAHYTVAAARAASGNGRIVCPNCGSETTRENLLDGCDYCGTRFRIEDLGNRVNSFVLRDDAETSLDKYREVKARFLPWVLLAVTAPVFLFSLGGMLSAWDAMDAGIGMKLVAVIFVVALLTGLAGFAANAVYSRLIDPILEKAGDVASLYVEKARKQQKLYDLQTETVVRRVRSGDRYFSRESFFSSVQNKLAAIHFAESPAEAQAFASADIRGLAGTYRDVVDMDAVEMHLTGYAEDGTNQILRMQANLLLISAGEKKFTERSEKIELALVRAASVKTEAVCAPRAYKCPGCGASLSLLNGGRCAYCGRSMDLGKYDWLVGEYRVLS